MIGVCIHTVSLYIVYDIYRIWVIMYIYIFDIYICIFDISHIYIYKYIWYTNVVFCTSILSAQLQGTDVCPDHCSVPPHQSIRKWFTSTLGIFFGVPWIFSWLLETGVTTTPLFFWNWCLCSPSMSEISPVFHQRIYWITRNHNHPPLRGWTKLDSPPTVVWGVCSGLDNKLDSEGRVVDYVKIQVFQQGTAVFAAEGWIFDPSVDSSRFFFPKILVFPSRKEIQFWENLQFFGGPLSLVENSRVADIFKQKCPNHPIHKGFHPVFFLAMPSWPKVLEGFVAFCVG